MDILYAGGGCKVADVNNHGESSPFYEPPSFPSYQRSMMLHTTETLAMTVGRYITTSNVITVDRVATVREKSLENEIFSRSGKSQGISIFVREI